MSDEHTKGAKREHGPKHNDPPAGKSESHAVVYTIRIEPTPDDKTRDAEQKRYQQDQLDVSRGQLRAYKTLNWISGVGGFIALLALIALVVNAFLLHNANSINKTAFDRAYRPYIGVNGVAVKYLAFGPKGPQVFDRANPNTKAIDFSAEIKNFGPVPGTNYAGDWVVFLNGVKHGATKIPDHPFTFFPGQNLYLVGQVGAAYYQPVLKGAMTLRVEVTIDYDGPNGHYHECTAHQYVADSGAFASLGPCPVN